MYVHEAVSFLLKHDKYSNTRTKVKLTPASTEMD